MKLKLVTITGCDDSTDIADMVRLSKQYPFVEWAILINASVLNFEILKIAQRIQLNFHAEAQKFFPEAFLYAIRGIPHDIIFQHDGRNDYMMQSVTTSPYLTEDAKRNLGWKDRFVPLYDASHGAGVLPEYWPTPNCKAKMYGYAGGLGPDNIEMAIEEINMVVPEDAEVWIDQETRIRTDDGVAVDFAKVETVLSLCEPRIAVGTKH